MVKIRLKRIGAKKKPVYRIVVMNNTTKRDGKPIQELGFYNPKTKEMKLDKELALDWIKKGAQPTETAQYLIDNCDDEGKLIVKEKTAKLSKKALAKQESEKAAQEEAAQKAKEEAQAQKEAEKAAKAEAEAKAKEEAEAAKVEEAPAEEKVEEVKEEAKAEEPAEEVKTEEEAAK